MTLDPFNVAWRKAERRREYRIRRALTRLIRERKCKRYDRADRIREAVYRMGFDVKITRDAVTAEGLSPLWVTVTNREVQYDGTGEDRQAQARPRLA